MSFCFRSCLYFLLLVRTVPLNLLHGDMLHAGRLLCSIDLKGALKAFELRPSQDQHDVFSDLLVVIRQPPSSNCRTNGRVVLRWSATLGWI